MSEVGKKLTSRVIAKIGDVRRFKNARSVIAYAGLDAPPYQLGQFEATNKHVSKRRNKYLRRTGLAKIARLNKFLKIYYGIVKNKYK